jgi:hypothetical protein
MKKVNTNSIEQFHPHGAPPYSLTFWAPNEFDRGALGPPMAALRGPAGPPIRDPGGPTGPQSDKLAETLF